ncbi:hypothetical protein PPL_06806 [Heterostelium album PN500]|uniref:AIG1-type G domain-containing protein n=1 Tax=Heterostelium pallidum (strain ATCC 26659 / Pp 5 / PN500) TaxID=670386 RepID=D3BDK4_HETP5|nr:hypothetical protein PPL_06806 [Heterostelium album PN500]EFA79985.1 hypothetical protein PPL_06806 [Heterostelium album PN500]|eukprot:XP_020432105.1 hypothetical protein PPL_06806 [Heterostelium album PN500]
MKYETIIGFYGNPGSGKSTICNSLIGKGVFQSGVSIGTGLTKQAQYYLLGKDLIVDTPGMADVLAKDTTVKEIEKSLKKGGNYKIVFVITLDSGRIKLQDFNTLNYILESINTEFNYGLLINQVSKSSLAKMNSDNIQACLQTLKKKPFHILSIKKIKSLDEKENQMLDESSVQDIQSFLSTLPGVNLLQDQVKSINITDFNRKLMELETLVFELMKSIKEDREREEILLQLNENSQRLLEQEIKANRDLDSQVKSLNEKVQSLLKPNHQPQRRCTIQ